jgi:hypothetical protein
MPAIAPAAELALVAAFFFKSFSVWSFMTVIFRAILIDNAKLTGQISDCKSFSAFCMK